MYKKEKEGVTPFTRNTGSEGVEGDRAWLRERHSGPRGRRELLKGFFFIAYRASGHARSVTPIHLQPSPMPLRPRAGHGDQPRDLLASFAFRLDVRRL